MAFSDEALGIFSNPHAIFEAGKVEFVFKPINSTETNTASKFIAIANWARNTDGFILKNDEYFSIITDGSVIHKIIAHLIDFLHKCEKKDSQVEILFEISLRQLSNFLNATTDDLLSELRIFNLVFALQENDLSNHSKEENLSFAKRLYRKKCNFAIFNYSGKQYDISYLQQLNPYGLILNQDYSIELLTRLLSNLNTDQLELGALTRVFNSFDFVSSTFTNATSAQNLATLIPCYFYYSGPVCPEFLKPVERRTVKRDVTASISDATENIKNRFLVDTHALLPDDNSKLKSVSRFNSRTVGIILIISLGLVSFLAYLLKINQKDPLIGLQSIVNARSIKVEVPYDSYIVDYKELVEKPVSVGEEIARLRLDQSSSSFKNSTQLFRDRVFLGRQLLALEADLNEALLKYKADQDLFSQGVVSKNTLELSRRLYYSTKQSYQRTVQLDAALSAQNLEDSFQSRGNADLYLAPPYFSIDDSTYFNDYGEYSMISPVDGYIYSDNFGTNAFIRKNSIVATAFNCSDVWVEVVGNANDTQRIDVSKPVNISFKNNKSKFTGTVRDIIPYYDDSEKARSTFLEVDRGVLPSVISSVLKDKPMEKVLVDFNSRPKFFKTQPYCGLGLSASLDFEFK